MPSPDIYDEVFSIINELKMIALKDEAKQYKHTMTGPDVRMDFQHIETSTTESLQNLHSQKKELQHIETNTTESLQNLKVPMILNMGNLRMSPKGSIENIIHSEPKLTQSTKSLHNPSHKQEQLMKKMDSQIMEHPVTTKEDYYVDPKIETLMRESQANLTKPKPLAKKSSSFEDLKNLTGSLKRTKQSPLKVQIQPTQETNPGMLRSDTLVIENPTMNHISNKHLDKVEEQPPFSPSAKTPKLNELMIQQFQEQKNLSNQRRMSDYKSLGYPWNSLYDLEPQKFPGDVEKYMKYITQFITEPQLTIRKADLDTKKPSQGFWYLLNICKFPPETFSVRLLTVREIDPEIKRHLLKDNVVYTAFNLLLTKIGPYLKDREKWAWICYAVPPMENHGTDLDLILNDPLPFVIAAKELKLSDMKDLYRLLDFNGTSFGLISYLLLDSAVFEKSHQYYLFVQDFIEANVFYWMNKAWSSIIKLKADKWFDTFCDEAGKVAIPYITQRFFRMIKLRYGIDFLKEMIINYCVSPAFIHGKLPVPELTEPQKKKFQAAIDKLLKTPTTSSYTPKLSDSSFQFSSVNRDIANLIKNNNFIRYCRLIETSLVLETIALQHSYQ